MEAELRTCPVTMTALIAAITETYSACPLCGGQEAALLGKVDCTKHVLWHEPLPATLDWLKCGGCGHIFTHSFYTADGLAELFSRANPEQVTVTDWERVRYTWSATVNRVLQTLPDRDLLFDGKLRWLDVGCGNGGLVSTAAEFGFEAIGLDTREEAVNKIREMGYPAHCGDLMSVTSDRPFHVISMADVLEHISHPLKTLGRARELLDDRGVLFVSCPNMDSLSWRQIDQSSTNPYWGEIEHHHNFSRSALASALRQAGFRPAGYAVSPRYIACMEVIAVKAGV